MMEKIKKFLGDKAVFLTALIYSLGFTIVIIGLYTLNSFTGTLFLFIMLFEIIYFFIKFINYDDGEDDV